MSRTVLRIMGAWIVSAVVGSATVWANSAPQVTNVTATQRTDGSMRVDIHYNLADADGDACTVSVVASDDGGATWDVPVLTRSGAVGAGITPGASKHIVWDCVVDLPDFAGSLKVRVIASDQPAIGSMVFVPGSSFEMGDSFDEGGSDELPVHTVYLSPYHIDTYEVTNQQYADALNWAWAQGGLITVTSGAVYQAGSGTSYPYCSTTSAPTGSPHFGEYSRITWNGSTFGVVSGKESHPMVVVSWYGSVAFCNWRSALEGKPLCYDLSSWTCNFGVAGYRLPTEAEWEKAARGGVPGHRFPWSDVDTIQHARANYYSSTSYSYDTSPTRGYHPDFDDGGSPYTSPVGYFASNDYGVYDMAGNVWEWCNDWYSGTYYSSSPGSNPTGPASGWGRVLRGGGWINDAYHCRCAYRHYNTPAHRHYSHEFRLALDGE